MKEDTLKIINALGEQDVGFLSVLVKTCKFPEDLPATYAVALINYLVEKVNSDLCTHSLEWLEFAVERYPGFLNEEQRESLQTRLTELLSSTPLTKTLCKFKGRLEMNDAPEHMEVDSESEDMEYELLSDDN